MNKDFFKDKSNAECKAIVENLVKDNCATTTDWDTTRREPCFYIDIGISDTIALTLRETRILQQQLEIALSPFNDFSAGEAAK